MTTPAEDLLDSTRAACRTVARAVTSPEVRRSTAYNPALREALRKLFAAQVAAALEATSVLALLGQEDGDEYQARNAGLVMLSRRAGCKGR